jgi:sulfatase modifying factor 1
MNDRRPRIPRTTRAVGALVVAWVTLGLACGEIVGIHDIVPPDAGDAGNGAMDSTMGSEGSMASEGSAGEAGADSADASPDTAADAPPDATSDAPPDATSDAPLDSTTTDSGATDTGPPTCACASDQYCSDSGTCVTGCDISGVPYASAAPNPANPCQLCQPTSSTSAWTNAGAGSSCGNASICNATGQCAMQCDIGGTIYPTGPNPAEPCQQYCIPAESTSSWSIPPPGTGCGSGSTTQFCFMGTCEVPPSCAHGAQAPQPNGMSNCGAGADQSCCTSLEVTGGTFYRSYSYELDAGVGPSNEGAQATVSTFRLDEYEVTVGRFRQFAGLVLPPDGGTPWAPQVGSGTHVYLNGGLGLANAGAGGGYEGGWQSTYNQYLQPTSSNLSCSSYATWTATPGSHENLPMNCVDWWEAYAFCIWDGGFLPSDAELEYAAAGGSSELAFPWGSTPPPGSSDDYAIWGCYYPVGNPFNQCSGVQNFAVVGTASLGVGSFGQLDLAGSVFEWDLDWAGSGYLSPCTNCANLTEPATPAKVNRGGSFSETSLTSLSAPTANLSSQVF